MKLKWSQVKEKAGSAREKTGKAAQHCGGWVKNHKRIFGAWLISGSILAVTFGTCLKNRCEQPRLKRLRKEKEKAAFVQEKKDHVTRLEKNCSRKKVSPPHKGCLTTDELAAAKKEAEDLKKKGQPLSAAGVYIRFGDTMSAGKLRSSEKCRKKCRKKINRRLEAWAQALEIFTKEVRKRERGEEPVEPKERKQEKPKKKTPQKTDDKKSAEAEMELEPEEIKRSHKKRRRRRKKKN